MTLGDLAGRESDDIAVECGQSSITWAALEDRTARFANGLRAMGLRPGEHVAIMVSNRIEFIEATIGAWRAGCSYTPIKTGWTAREVAFVVEDARTRVIVTDRAAGREVAQDPRVTLIDVDDGYTDWLASQDPSPPDDSQCGWKVPFTSGTTGRPKGVVMSAAGRGTFSDSWRATARYAEMLGLPGHGVHLFLSRLFNGAPMTFGLGALARGATMRILPTWEPQAALSALCAPDVTSTIAVPTMFRQLQSLPRQRPGTALETILHGGEPCPASVKQAMLDWFGPVLVEYYGFTEGGMTITTSAEWLAKPGTVGRPMPGLGLRIVGPDCETLPPGEVGTIAFVPEDGERRFSYLNDPMRTDAAHLHDAFTVGDTGWVDEDGFLFIAGRSDDIVLVAGVNVYPAEIEDALADVEGVADLCAVGVPDPLRGEQVVLAISLRPEASEQQVRTSLADAIGARLAPYKRPTQIVVASTIPRDETGKLLRGRMRGALCAAFDSSAELEGPTRGAAR